MRRDSLFCYIIHPPCPYLNLDPDAGVAHQSAVQGLITVVLRMFHPVPYPVWLVPVDVGDDGEHMVALVPFGLSRAWCRREDDSHCIQVIYLVEGDSLGHHLVPDGIRSLDPFLDFKIESCRFQGLGDRGDEFVDLLLLVCHVPVDLGGNVVVGLRLLVPQPDILHLRLNLIQTQSVGKRNEDEHGLAQDLVPLVLRHELDCPAVVQTVGQLDQHNPHIVIQSQQDTLEILCLKASCLGLGVIVEDNLDLSEPVHKQGNPVPEQIADVVHSVVGIFHHIVQKGRRDGLVAQSDVGHYYLRHSDRMKYIRLSTASPDPFMGLVGKLEGFLHYIQLLLVGAALDRSFLEICVIACYHFIILLGKFGKAHCHSRL